MYHILLISKGACHHVPKVRSRFLVVTILRSEINQSSHVHLFSLPLWYSCHHRVTLVQGHLNQPKGPLPKHTRQTCLQRIKMFSWAHPVIHFLAQSHRSIIAHSSLASMWTYQHQDSIQVLRLTEMSTLNIYLTMWRSYIERHEDVTDVNHTFSSSSAITVISCCIHHRDYGRPN